MLAVTAQAQIAGTGTALLDGERASRQHEAGHTDAPNWPAAYRG